MLKERTDTAMDRRNDVQAEVRQLTSGYWAVFIGGIWVDAASPSEEAAQAKLNKFLLSMGRKSK